MHFQMLRLLLFFLCSPQTVGVIIRLDRDMFSVLNQHGKVSFKIAFLWPTRVYVYSPLCVVSERKLLIQVSTNWLDKKGCPKKIG